MRVCSLFSGIGGIDLGFKQAGFDIAWANEFDKDAAATYRHNFGSEHLVEKDIRKVDALEIPDFDVLVVGFPCQPFSIIGFRKGFNNPRVSLFLTDYNALAPQDEIVCERFKFPEKVDLTVKLNDILIRELKHDDCYYYNRS